MFGPQTSTQDVYEVAAQPVVKAAMEGIHGMFSGLNCFHLCVTHCAV